MRLTIDMHTGEMNALQRAHLPKPGNVKSPATFRQARARGQHIDPAARPLRPDDGATLKRKNAPAARPMLLKRAIMKVDPPATLGCHLAMVSGYDKHPPAPDRQGSSGLGWPFIAGVATAAGVIALIWTVAARIF